jgi:flavin reductase (DIM6/NTAB) family NADH-FMN oxidoreductase RutF
MRIIGAGDAVKKEVGPKNCLYPMPSTLVGAMVNGKPNYIAIAHVGIMDPGSVSLGMNKAHYTNAGIKEAKTFSINIPSEEQVVKADYCGLVSGKNVDKSRLFTTFFGKLKTAPMIEECPVNMECQLVRTVDFPRHDIFIGEVVDTFCDEAVLTDGVLDFDKMRPLLFTMGDRGYWSMGRRVADAWGAGKKMK